MSYALVAGAGHIHHGKFAGRSASQALSGGGNVCWIFEWFMMFLEWIIVKKLDGEVDCGVVAVCTS